MPEADARIFYEMCAGRERGVPIAYLTKHKEFYGLDFYVDERVLIPRPETELVVELALEQKFFHLVDVGTGSGCIAVALAKHLPKAKITAIDISAGALEVARMNAEHHGVLQQIEFLRGDLLEPVLRQKIQSFAVVANLPYIGEEEFRLVSREVADFEPREALFGGKTGLELFEKMFAQIAAFPAMPNFIAAEMGFLQRKPLEKLITRFFPAASVEWRQDLAGLDRAFSIL